MVAVYSALLAQGSAPAGVETTVYTAPAVGTVVVRDIVLGVLSGSSTGIQLFVDSGLTRTVLAVVTGISATAEQHRDLRQVLLPGDKIVIKPLTTASVYRISGYVLGL
jgi:hypothetical protein